mgnify:CR=1 FL=1|tara:strand:- start:603 stop:845 length:243 start_codon:yes stop_codon:yes gene_type:complete
MISRVFIIGTVEEVNKISFVISYSHNELTPKGWAKIAYETEIIGVLTMIQVGQKLAIEGTLKGSNIMLDELHILPTSKGE